MEHRGGRAKRRALLIAGSILVALAAASLLAGGLVDLEAEVAEAEDRARPSAPEPDPLRAERVPTAKDTGPASTLEPAEERGEVTEEAPAKPLPARTVKLRTTRRRPEWVPPKHVEAPATSPRPKGERVKTLACQVRGRLVDPEGNPVPNTEVLVFGRPHGFEERSATPGPSPFLRGLGLGEVLARGRSGLDGTFRIDYPYKALYPPDKSYYEESWRYVRVHASLAVEEGGRFALDTPERIPRWSKREPDLRWQEWDAGDVVVKTLCRLECEIKAPPTTGATLEVEMRAPFRYLRSRESQPVSTLSLPLAPRAVLRVPPGWSVKLAPKHSAIGTITKTLFVEKDQRLRWDLRPSATCSGIVLGPGGAPAANVDVEACEAAPSRKFTDGLYVGTELTACEASTDASGRFLIRGLVAGGTYRITSERGEGRTAAEAVVTVPAADLVLKTEEGGSLHYRVTGHRRFVLGTVEVRPHPKAPWTPLRRFGVMEKGGVLVGIPRGLVRLHARLDETSYYSNEVSMGSGREDVVLAFPPDTRVRRSLRGILTNAKGERLSGQKLEIRFERYPRAPTTVVHIELDKVGGFTWEKVPTYLSSASFHVGKLSAFPSLPGEGEESDHNMGFVRLE